MLRRLIVGCLFIGLAATLAWAQVSPVVQPAAAGYTSAQTTVLHDRIVALEASLGYASLGSRKTMNIGGWTALDFAAYTSGSLEAQGYQTAVVTQTSPTGVQRAWVLVRADLGGGVVAWIPVEPYPTGSSSQQTLGIVPRIGFTQYAAGYISFDEVVALPPNIPPMAIITPPVALVVVNMESAWFGHQSVDPDGEILRYQWTFGADVQRAVTVKSIWYAFQSSGREYLVELTVTDNRGAQATATYAVYVLSLAEWEEEQNCGCDKS
ncbi:PKD domain-containing protein [Candidatus Bipolaricaulota bacterium]